MHHIIEYHRQKRAEMAKNIRYGLTESEGRPTVRAGLRKFFLDHTLPHAPSKPTRSWLYWEACRMIRAARAPLPWEIDASWQNPYDTPTFSACGYEDGLAQGREDCREAALEYFRAWKSLSA